VRERMERLAVQQFAATVACAVGAWGGWHSVFAYAWASLVFLTAVLWWSRRRRTNRRGGEADVLDALLDGHEPAGTTIL